MRRGSIVLTVIALGLVIYLAAYVVANSGVEAERADIDRAAMTDLPQAGATLDLVTWNLGYAGLGAESDFVTDGGHHYFPPSRRAARDNAEGIRAFLGQQDVDVILNQEIAQGGPINYWIDLRGRVDGAMRERDRTFFADFKMRFAPWPLRMVHGQAIYSRREVADTDVIALPAENSGILGVRRRYAALVARLPIAGGGEWTIVSTHLAAFDDNAAVRTRQLGELLAWAQREFEAGHHVVIGGDFNLRLVATNFPSTTQQRHLFWVHPFPPGALAEGWRIAADARTPSVRTNERAYARGENYRTVIDGFIVSPNVRIEAVEGVDLDFRHSDHNPVRVRVRAVR